MKDAKRGRGRPKGSGEDDMDALMAVARLMTDDPGLKRTTAMKSLLRTRRDWKAASDSALIRRWQVKWKEHGSSYLQRVHDERTVAEAERQRREQAAAEVGLDGLRSARDLAVGVGVLSQLMPRQAIGEAVFGILNQHRELAQSIGGAIHGLAERGMLPGRSSVFDALNRSAIGDLMRSPAVGDALRAHRVMLDTPGLGEAMRKYGEMGRAMREAGAVFRTLNSPRRF